MTLAAATLAAWALPHAVETALRPGPVSFLALLVTGCEVVAGVGAGWLWLLVTLVVRDALRGRGTAGTPGVPAVVRRLVLAGCGLTLAGGGLLTPAHAAGGDPHRAVEVLVGLQVPDRMSTTAWAGAVRHEVRRQHPVGRARRPHPDGRSLVVQAGDTLWSLAVASLPPGADTVAVERRWRAIYRANRPVIGADPHLILPGQRLVLPPHDGEE